jgi:polyisoprenoid-binding protein YceI
MIRTQRRLTFALPILVGALLVGSCAAPSVRRAPEPANSAQQPATAPPLATPPSVSSAALAWQISNAESLLTIEVLRAGSMARLGHNHVIAARQIEGELSLAEPLEQSSIVLRLPVAGFTVDEPQLRAQAGADFSAAVPDSARSGTRANMLGSSLLDAAHFPVIELRSTAVARGADGLLLTLQIRIRDVLHTLSLPVKITRTDTTITASGECILRQSELGLTPFSIMMGALQVQDAMHLRFVIVAQPAARGGDTPSH